MSFHVLWILGLAHMALLLPIAGRTPFPGVAPGLVPQLPRLEHGLAIDAWAPTVVVTRSEVWVDGRVVDHIDASGRILDFGLAKALGKKRELWPTFHPQESVPPGAVYMRLDRDLSYGTVVDLMRQVHRAGYPEVSFIGVSVP